jgi:hypothetical protein
VGVVASNVFGAGHAYMLAATPANPNQAAELAAQAQATMDQAARSGNLVPAFQLFNVYMTAASQQSTRRLKMKHRTRSGRAVQDLTSSEAMAAASLQFNVDNCGGLGFWSAIQAHTSTMRQVHLGHSEILEATRTTAFTTTTELVSGLLAQTDAPPMTLSLAGKVFDLLRESEQVLFVTGTTDGSSIGNGPEQRAAYAMTLISLMAGVGKKLSIGPDAPQSVGTMFHVGGSTVHPDIQLSMAKVKTGTFLNAATVGPFAEPLSFGVLVMDTSCPMVLALPTLAFAGIGKAYVFASDVVEVESYAASSNSATSITLEVMLASSTTTSSKNLVCAWLQPSGEWTSADVQTSVGSAGAKADCTVPFGVDADQAVVLAVFARIPVAASTVSNTRSGAGSDDATNLVTANDNGDGDGGTSTSGSGASNQSGSNMATTEDAVAQIQEWHVILLATVGGIGVFIVVVLRYSSYRRTRIQSLSEEAGMKSMGGSHVNVVHQERQREREKLNKRWNLTDEEESHPLRSTSVGTGGDWQIKKNFPSTKLGLRPHMSSMSTNTKEHVVIKKEHLVHVRSQQIDHTHTQKEVPSISFEEETPQVHKQSVTNTPPRNQRTSFTSHKASNALLSISHTPSKKELAAQYTTSIPTSSPKRKGSNMMMPGANSTVFSSPRSSPMRPMGMASRTVQPGKHDPFTTKTKPNTTVYDQRTRRSGNTYV